MTHDGRKRLLIAEDNEADVYLLRTALENAGFRFDVEIAKNGERVLAVIEQASRSSKNIVDAMILDLNLVTHTGIQILQHVREHPLLGRIPVVILTSWESTADQRESERLGVSAYLKKPMDLTAFMEMGKEISKLLSVVDASK